MTPKPLLSVTNYNTQPYSKGKEQQVQTNLTIFHEPKNTFEDKMRTMTYFSSTHDQQRIPKI